MFYLKKQKGSKNREFLSSVKKLYSYRAKWTNDVLTHFNTDDKEIHCECFFRANSEYIFYVEIGVLIQSRINTHTYTPSTETYNASLDIGWQHISIDQWQQLKDGIIPSFNCFNTNLNIRYEKDNE